MKQYSSILLLFLQKRNTHNPTYLLYEGRPIPNEDINKQYAILIIVINSYQAMCFTVKHKKGKEVA